MTASTPLPTARPRAFGPSRAALFAVLLAVVASPATPPAAAALPAREAATVAFPVAAGEVSDLDEGTPLPAGRNVNLEKAAQARQAAAREQTEAPRGAVPNTGAGTIAGYRTSGTVPPILPQGLRPYDDEPIVPRQGDGLVDKEGVRMFRLASTGVVYNHPALQAQYAIRNLNSYRLTKDPVYLQRAIANAQRLVDTRVELAGGWYYPYDFDFAVHGDTSMTLKAPWYSAMAQGQVISAFVRAYEATLDVRWRDAANRTVSTLLSAPISGQVFVSWVDGSSHLWLEEYPRPDIVTSERVFNGHNFAVYGLYDYWLLTRDSTVLHLLDGALTTSAEMTWAFRRSQWASVYSLLHKHAAISYHHVHVEQLVMLYQLSERVRFIQWANTFRNDFPLRTESGTADLTPKSTVAYRLNAARQVISSRAIRFTRQTSAPANRRERSRGGPIMLRISVGPYTDWWFPEGPGKAWLRGAKEQHTYVPRTVGITFRPGTYTGYRYDSSGKRVGTKSKTFAANSWAPTARSGILEGRAAYFFTVGAWAGYWVPMSTGLVER